MLTTTASWARDRADAAIRSNTEKILKSIDLNIKLKSSSGEFSFVTRIDEPFSLKQVMDELKDQGYKAVWDALNSRMEISWY